MDTKEDYVAKSDAFPRRYKLKGGCAREKRGLTEPRSGSTELSAEFAVAISKQRARCFYSK